MPTRFSLREYSRYTKQWITGTAAIEAAEATAAMRADLTKTPIPSTVSLYGEGRPSTELPEADVTNCLRSHPWADTVLLEIRMKRLLCISAFVLALTSVGFAAPITFTGLLSGANENPATGSPGTGSAIVTYDSATHMLSVDVTFSGLGTGTIASHIHCCVLPNGNATVATTVPTFPGFPLGVTSGSYVHTLDLTLGSSFNPAFVASNGGTDAAAEAALAAGLADGMAYLNIHTTEFPNGEIRGFLQAIPEPTSGMLVIVALAGFWVMRRTRAHQ